MSLYSLGGSWLISCQLINPSRTTLCFQTQLHCALDWLHSFHRRSCHLSRTPWCRVIHSGNLTELTVIHIYTHMYRSLFQVERYHEKGRATSKGEHEWWGQTWGRRKLGPFSPQHESCSGWPPYASLKFHLEQNVMFRYSITPWVFNTAVCILCQWFSYDLHKIKQYFV